MIITFEMCAFVVITDEILISENFFKLMY